MLYGVVIDGLSARYIGVTVRIDRELNDGYFILCDGQLWDCIDKLAIRIINEEEYLSLLPKTKAILESLLNE